jgi:simple sugar transport system ATP-binding protein
VSAAEAPIIEAKSVSKSYGRVAALTDISTSVRAGEVTCVLGDNGAGKSTFIKILSGFHSHDSGELLLDGSPVAFENPRAALDAGIATLYQDLALLPLMSVWRNFFLGREPTKGFPPFRRLHVSAGKKRCLEELGRLGIKLRDADQIVGTLSGGERQAVAIARAIHFGARLIILDEPTAALGVRQSGIVLRNVAEARDRGLGLVLITHNPRHAYLVGDRFLVLNLGRSLGEFRRADVTEQELTELMAGGSEFEELKAELEEAPQRSQQANRLR